MSAQPGTITYLVRGTGYATTSVLALLAGYLISPKTFELGDLLVLAIAAVLSAPFFVVYAVCFHYDDPKTIVNEAVLRDQQDDAVKILPAICMPLAGLLLLVHHYILKVMPPNGALVGVVAYGTFFGGYAFLLYKNFARQDPPPIRHQLVWPVVFTIGLALYFGNSLQSIKNGQFAPWFPVILMFAFLVVSELMQFGRRGFVLGGAALILASSILVIPSSYGLVPPDWARHLEQLLFFIPISAYLACFESWRVTAYVAQEEGTKHSAPDPVAPARYLAYYFATLTAMAISIHATFFFFVFSSYGLVLLVGFALHAVFAFVVWYALPLHDDGLRKRAWPIHKLLMGFLFLAILVADAKFHFTPDKAIMQRFVGWDGWAAMIVLSGLVCTDLYKVEFPGALSRASQFGQNAFFALFWDRPSFVKASAPAATVLAAILLLILDWRDSPAFINRAHLAFVTYGSIVALAFVYVAFGFFGRIGSAGGAVVTVMVSLLVGGRWVTSSLIAFAAFLPLYWRGQGLLQALVLSMPFLLSAMGGFLLNDVYDLARDRVNEPSRVLPSGMISVDTARNGAVSLLSLAALISVLGPAPVLAKIIYIFALLGVVAYSPIAVRFTLVKNAFSASLCALPLVFVWHTCELSARYLWVLCGYWVFLMGRELLMDVKDMQGDSVVGLKTLAVRWGAKNSSDLAFALQICGIILAMGFYESGIRGLPLLTIGSFFAIWTSVSWILWHSGSQPARRRLISLMRLPLLSGISIFLT